MPQAKQSLNEADQALGQNNTQAAQTALQNAQNTLRQIQTAQTGQGQQSGANADVIVTGEEEADVTIIRPDEEEEAELGDAGTQEADTGMLGQRRAEEVIGQPLVNATGEEIGDIKDLVLDSGQVVYAVVGVGGFLGMGERKVTIPFEQIQLSEDEARIMTLMTEEDLKALPEYDPEQYEPMERERTIGG